MDVNTLRNDFPFFAQTGAPVYLDQAATAQKPRAVLDRLWRFYAGENANIHRGGYALARQATEQYEHARGTVADFVGIPAGQVAFTLNATDSLNQAIALTAQRRFAAGKNAVTTAAEHHSAFLPLQRACQQTGTELRILPLKENGDVDIAQLDAYMDENTVCAVLTLGSNVTGWTLPSEVPPLLKQRGVTVILDGTQRIVHEPLNVQTLGCDFLCFSGHKLYGPTGIGVLCMNGDWASTAVARLGGGMVEEVSVQGFVRAADARALEAGTPPIAQALGLEAALQYLSTLDMQAVRRHEQALRSQLVCGLCAIPGIHVLGEDRPDTLPIVAFTADWLHAADLCRLLDLHGIAVRGGRHCAHLFHNQMGLSATVRASMGLYTLPLELDTLLSAVDDIGRKWRGIRDKQ